MSATWRASAGTPGPVHRQRARRGAKLCTLSARGSLIQEHGMKVGVALKPGTPMEAVAPFVGLVDMVLVAAFQPSL